MANGECSATRFASPRLRGGGSACGRTSGAGVRALPEVAPSLAAAPLPETPPHPRLLRRLAAFGGPLPASGERRLRYALRAPAASSGSGLSWARSQLLRLRPPP